MKGWTKLGALLDRKDSAPAPQPASNGQGLIDRLASMVANLERRLKEAFNNGQAARRFNGADVVALPAAHYEEVREAAPPRYGMSVGRFEHVTQMRFQDLEEVLEQAS